MVNLHLFHNYRFCLLLYNLYILYFHCYLFFEFDILHHFLSYYQIYFQSCFLRLLLLLHFFLLFCLFQIDYLLHRFLRFVLLLLLLLILCILMLLLYILLFFFFKFFPFLVILNSFFSPTFLLSFLV